MVMLKMAIEDYFPGSMADSLMFMILLCCFASAVGSSISGSSGADFEIPFTAYRLRQYDSSGVAHGSLSYKFAYDAAAFNDTIVRKCAIIRWSDLKGKDLNSIFQQSAGAVVVIVPRNLHAPRQKSSGQVVEEHLAAVTTNQAVYFAIADQSTEKLLDCLRNTKTETAMQQIYNIFAENVYQVSSTTSLSSNSLTMNYVNVIGYLNAPDKNAPSVVIVAHYDSRGLAPGLSTGYDSNGSGVMALTAIMKRLSEYYRVNEMRPKLRTIFALTSLGSFNYRGSRQFAEELIELQNRGERVLLVICLEALLGNGGLYAHISKPLQEKTAPHNFLRRMSHFITDPKEHRVVVRSVDTEYMAWEHEIYFHNRISSLTLSHYSNYNDPSRLSLISDVDARDETKLLEKFKWRVNVISQTLVSYTFGVEMNWCTEEHRAVNGCDIAREFNAVDENIRQLMSQPRPMADLPSNIVPDLYELTNYYCSKSEKRIFSAPDLQLYGGNVDTLVAQIVKPALFELALAAAIGLYLTGLYQLSLNAHKILSYVTNVMHVSN